MNAAILASPGVLCSRVFHSVDSINQLFLSADPKPFISFYESFVCILGPF